MDRIEIAVRIIERTVAMVISNGLKIDIDTLVNDAFDVADKVVERDNPTYSSWANWIAQDANGDWFCYRRKPAMKHDTWRPAGNDLNNFIRADDPNPNWRDTLRRLR